MIVEAVLPCIPVKNLADRIHQLRKFLFRRREVERNFSTERGSLNAIFRHAYHGLLAIDGWVNRLGNIDIEPSSHPLVFRGDGFNDFATKRHLIKGRHALLTVEQERLRCYLPRICRGAFDGTWLEIHGTPRVEGHQGAYREGARY